MKVIVSGSSGLVGSALLAALTEAGHTAIPLVRGEAGENQVGWDPQNGQIDVTGLEGADAVVHLAGESIAEGRWTAAKKARIRDSRVEGTTLISNTLAALDQKPATLVSASAIGFYGDRGDEILDEDSKSGDSFLAEVCREWEAATAPAEQAGIRVAHLRTGIVLSTEGGALPQLLTPFRLGVGGVVGSGQQWWSWITRHDLAQLILFLLSDQSLAGPINAVAPNPVTNREFTKTLGRALNRPTIIPMPAPLARLALGEMADALILASARVVPTRLRQAGFAFYHDELPLALEMLLHQSPDD